MGWLAGPCRTIYLAGYRAAARGQEYPVDDIRKLGLVPDIVFITEIDQLIGVVKHLEVQCVYFSRTVVIGDYLTDFFGCNRLEP